MASFNYIAQTSSGDMQKGLVAASNRAAALASLRQRGLLPIVVKEAGTKMALPKLRLPGMHRKVKSRDVVIFTRELSTMINAGVPIVKSLRTLSDQADSPLFHKTLEAIRARVESGAPLSDAMAEHPKVFSLVYVNMVRAGETGGILDQILNRLAVQVEKEANLKGKLRGAMIYPAVISVVMFGAFIFLMTGIVPKLKGIFDEYQAQLPLLTRVMLGISGALQKHGLILGVVAAISLSFLIRTIKRPRGKYVFDRLLLRSPILGKILLKVDVARFARTFSSLTAAGVSVLDGLAVTSKSIKNAVLSQGVAAAAQNVKNGQSISDSLEQTQLLPPIVPQMIAVGEETGKVDEVLAKVADFYEQEVDRVAESLTSIIEPLLIIVLGGMVGLIVASIFGPISSLTNVVQ